MKSAWLLLVVMAVCNPAQANYRHQQGDAGGSDTDVIVNMPAEAWTQGQNRQQNCLQCCIFENRNYTEGAVVKSEGVLLQCARDEKSLGTNNLIWKIVK